MGRRRPRMWATPRLLGARSRSRGCWTSACTRARRRSVSSASTVDTFAQSFLQKQRKPASRARWGGWGARAGLAAWPDGHEGNADHSGSVGPAAQASAANERPGVTAGPTLEAARLPPHGLQLRREQRRASASSSWPATIRPSTCCRWRRRCLRTRPKTMGPGSGTGADPHTHPLPPAPVPAPLQ